MGRGINEAGRAQELEPVSLSALIHRHVRIAIETAVHEELRAALGTSPYERRDVRRGYRNGVRERTLTGPTGPVALTLPRATLFNGAGDAKNGRRESSRAISGECPFSSGNARRRRQARWACRFKPWAYAIRASATGHPRP